MDIIEGKGLVHRYSHEDLAAVLGDRLVAVLAGGFPFKASFAVKFVDSKTPRSVSIWQSGRASYTRDEDRLQVEAWMREQEFLVKAVEETDEEAEAVLADA